MLPIYTIIFLAQNAVQLDSFSPGSGYSVTAAIVRLASALCITAGISFLLFWFVRKTLRNGRNNEDAGFESIRLVSKTYLTQKKAVYLVRVADTLILLADSDKGFVRLGEFEGSAKEAATPTGDKRTNSIHSRAGIIETAEKLKDLRRSRELESLEGLISLQPATRDNFLKSGNGRGER